MENKSGKLAQANKGSKINNYQTNTQSDDLALANVLLLTPKQEEKELTDEEIQDVVVYDNGATMIDFMLPEDEREILEQNLNNYSDMEKMKKVLNMAKKNKLLKEEVETLNQVAKTDTLINNIFDIMNNEENLDMINKYIRQKLASGQDVAKAYKEIGLMNKAMMDAREGMINRMKSKKSGKNTKIAIRFTNDNGEDFELGAEFDE